MTKPTKWLCAQRRLRSVWASAQSDQSLRCPHEARKLGFLSTHLAHSEGSDQTGRMPRLIWVSAGRTVTLLVLSWGGSYDNNYMEGKTNLTIPFYMTNIPETAKGDKQLIDARTSAYPTHDCRPDNVCSVRLDHLIDFYILYCRTLQVKSCVIYQNIQPFCANYFFCLLSCFLDRLLIIHICNMSTWRN